LVSEKRTSDRTWKCDANGAPAWRDDANTTYGLASTSDNGLLRKLSGNTGQYLRGDGTWQNLYTTLIGSLTAKNGFTLSNGSVVKMGRLCSVAVTVTCPNISSSKWYTFANLPSGFLCAAYMVTWTVDTGNVIRDCGIGGSDNGAGLEVYLTSTASGKKFHFQATYITS
jgi:hypothetical protein